MKQVSGMVLSADGPIWVELTYDSSGHETRVVVRPEKNGEILACSGCIGIKAVSYYNRMNKYFFGE